ncbi:MAG: virulence RhuM family protein [Anaeroplasmataceae bacterium]|nr:virulence RhuM family protein [Anaeroplasmataceae bacterium]
MLNNENKYDLIKFEDGEFSLDVNVSPNEDTVWLNSEQIQLLFNCGKSTLSYHIKNIFNQKELFEKAVVRNFRTTASDGKTYNVKYYNLDMIISIGYRVNSKRGILFRKWATSILKQYMLNGYSVNEKRCLECQENLVSLNNKVNTLIGQTNDNTNSIQELRQPDKLLFDKLFFEGEIFDAYSYIKQLLHSAKSSITLIDGYIDLSVLDMLVGITLPITIYTYPSSTLTNQDIAKFNIHHNLTIIKTNKIHDRFIIINNEIYLCGSSIKDVGKKRFVLTRLESISKESLLKEIKKEDSSK